MAVNTNQLNDGQYVTTSSISIVGGPSRTTLIAQDVTATSVLSTAQFKASTLTVNSTASINGAVTLQGATTSNATITTLAISATRFVSSGTTAQSGATAKIGDGQLFFSVLSLTSNGAEFGFRSGNTVYRFTSDLAG